ncbi:hypothetical protein [Parasphingorhabdus cellanae]|uniref:Uncharacterized protein n=1 Tax=Parasphingorhabdus cellanae TaxID=2806553 RepID=A0ABX7T222_9SPHN|nr:hypothetical protein [Parasphingorhabdus cellanae]QTD54845.1 hypothetical protein J4G78_11355 [Parasphingorhabdus cellanae]
MLRNILLWIGAISLALVSSLAALGSITKTKRPELALSLQPTNGFAAEKMAVELVIGRIVKDRGKFPDQINPSWYKLALQAFETEPVSPAAIAVIALTKTGNVRRSLMEKAFNLSRRQQLVTGWMIADSGSRNDIPSILQFYDTTLRTSTSSAGTIIPVMANALENENFVEPFAAILSVNPPWADLFWAKVAATPIAITNAADLRRLLYKKNDQNEDFRDNSLINALVNNNRIGKAEQLYMLFTNASGDDHLIRDSEFNSEPVYPPFDWQLFSTGEYGAAIGKGRLNLSAIHNSGGLFARQLVKLPKRILDMEVEAARDIPENAELSLGLSCAEDIKNRPSEIDIPLKERITTRKISNQGSPCEYYWVSISGRSSDHGDGFDIAITSVSLRNQ